mmetsp:Transcript_1317/g.3377  ORF Transcript_1317/g.3377 Transcript_1317/m.3377 type:complete len:113 (-) Transcript_1317:122-460(-)
MVRLAFLTLALVGCGALMAPRTPSVSGRRSTIVSAQTPLTANGRRVEVPAGSSMLAACRKLGLNVPTNCKKGDCGTCTVIVGGKQIRACVGKVPPAPRLKSVAEKGLPVKKA